jgi:hypothetical protein
MELLIFLLVLFGNLWIWKIASYDIFLLILVIVVSLLFYLIVTKRKSLYKLFFSLFVLLLVFQWRTTGAGSLTNLTNDQKRIQQLRLREYPPVYFSIAGKTIWIPIAHWFEGRRESIAAFRIMKNFSEVVDPNLYFFANHPRERIGMQEFEKFPYLFLPFFIYGSFLLIENKKGKVLAFVIIAPSILISIIGNNNPLGPFSLFPLFVGNTAVGLQKTFEIIIKRFPAKRKFLIAGFLILYLLIFIQVISYARA